MLLFIGGVVYGVVFLVVLVLFLLLTLAAYVEHIEDFREDMDSLDMFFEMLSLLGAPRVFLAAIVAFLWPLSGTCYLMFWFPLRGKYCEELPAPVRSVLLWVFLGFGKFKSKEEERVTT